MKQLPFLHVNDECPDCGKRRHKDWRECPVQKERLDRFWRQYSALQRQFGRGETFSQHERSLILDKIVPSWVMLGIRTGKTEELIERCQRAAFFLERLHKDLGLETP